MRWRRILLACICSLVLVHALHGGARALYLDERRTLEVVGKAQSRGAFRLEESEGFTYPTLVTGDLVQWRNMLLLEINHDLKYLMNKTALLYPFRALKLRVKYRLVGRFVYDAVYDVGPEALRDVFDADEENIDNFRQSYELWEGYADISRGPFFLRAGRQNLSWGETDIFRLLDNINPLDNTFGGISEDLEDRRIPLIMLRASYNLGSVGPASSLTLESFWVPGFLDVHVGPWAPRGTPYAPPKAPLPFGMEFIHPDRKMANSRWGFRLMGLLWDNLNVTVAHYKTFLDTPAVRVGVEPGLRVLLSPSQATQQLIWEDVQITGGSFNFCEPHTDIVFRGEVAWFWDEPVFIPEENLKLSDQEIPLPPAVVELLSQILGVDLAALGFRRHPGEPHRRRDPAEEHPPVHDRLRQAPLAPVPEPPEHLLRQHAVLRPVDSRL